MIRRYDLHHEDKRWYTGITRPVQNNKTQAKTGDREEMHSIIERRPCLPQDGALSTEWNLHPDIQQYRSDFLATTRYLARIENANAQRLVESTAVR